MEAGLCWPVKSCITEDRIQFSVLMVRNHQMALPQFIILYSIVASI